MLLRTTLACCSLLTLGLLTGCQGRQYHYHSSVGVYSQENSSSQEYGVVDSTPTESPAGPTAPEIGEARPPAPVIREVPARVQQTPAGPSVPLTNPLPPLPSETPSNTSSKVDRIESSSHQIQVPNMFAKLGRGLKNLGRIKLPGLSKRRCCPKPHSSVASSGLAPLPDSRFGSRRPTPIKSSESTVQQSQNNSLHEGYFTPARYAQTNPQDVSSGDSLGTVSIRSVYSGSTENHPNAIPFSPEQNQIEAWPYRKDLEDRNHIPRSRHANSRLRNAADASPAAYLKTVPSQPQLHPETMVPAQTVAPVEAPAPTALPIDHPQNSRQTRSFDTPSRTSNTFLESGTRTFPNEIGRTPLPNQNELPVLSAPSPNRRNNLSSKSETSDVPFHDQFQQSRSRQSSVNVRRYSASSPNRPRRTSSATSVPEETASRPTGMYSSYRMRYQTPEWANSAGQRQQISSRPLRARNFR